MTTKRKTYITPTGTARYPWLNKADVKFKDEGEYHTELVVNPEDTIVSADRKVSTPIREFLDGLMVEAEKRAKDAGAKGKQAKPATDLYVPEVDEDGEETGAIIIKATAKASGVNAKGEKWERTVRFADAKGNKMKPVAVYGGSTLRLAVAPNIYQSNFGYGVKLYLEGVQVLELSEGASVFGAVDGYDYEAPEDYDDEPSVEAPAGNTGGEPEDDEDW